MKLGLKSLLFGTHQFIWHPVTVMKAWTELYGIPNIKEVVCIIVHDWGYWNCDTIDGEDGKEHPKLGASFAKQWFGEEYYELCLYHSRSYAKANSHTPSKLCWADKLSIAYDPPGFYLWRSRLTGELDEFRLNADASGFIPITASDLEWYNKIKTKFIHEAT